MNPVQRAMAELEGAEAIFDYLGVAFEPRVLEVSRLHVLQRFHQYLENAGRAPQEVDAARTWYAAHLALAYHDFIHSTPARERVFAVFQRGRDTVEVPVSTLRTGRGGDA